jgi:uncharacterized protein (DUF342 family)
MSSEESEKVSPSELISTGQPILTLTNEKESPAITLEAGENTELSSDGSELFSRCAGYPKITITKSEDNYTIRASLIPLVEVSEEGMEAWLNLFHSLPDQDFLNAEMISQALKQQGVVYGIDRHAIETILNKAGEEVQPQPNYFIARGKAPKNGEDAYVRFEVEIGPLPGRILADGSIDFRERLMFVGVKKDQLLACKVPATQGHPGTNLAGEQLEAADGNDIAVKVSEDVHYCENDGTIRATASGVLSVVGDDTIRVSSKQKITGDINFHTGNIRSNDSLEISGSLQPGFLVSAKGNVSIDGSIQFASVNSHGNIVIKGGIIGNKSKIRVEGDADFHHIENGLLVAGGNVVIRSGAYYSFIQAGGSIHCPETVKLVGGDVVAGGSLSCGKIGSPTADPINIAVGVDPHRYRRYQDLQQEYNEVLQETQEWYNRYGRARQEPLSFLELETKLRAIEQEISSLNLIPDTPEDSLRNRIFSHTEASVSVHNCITAGNIVRIGNEIMVVEDDLDSCIIKLNKKSGAITVNPLQQR